MPIIDNPNTTDISDEQLEFIRNSTQAQGDMFREVYEQAQKEDKFKEFAMYGGIGIGVLTVSFMAFKLIKRQ